ncbi:hypothetical protein II1_05771 [Bacillus cereus MC118]|nr:hypothetical protein II1_05771 [Bacillus cereus MC118]
MLTLVVSISLFIFVLVLYIFFNHLFFIITSPFLAKPTNKKKK